MRLGAIVVVVVVVVVFVVGGLGDQACCLLLQVGCQAAAGRLLGRLDLRQRDLLSDVQSD
jgi:hypothetical protein